MQIVKKLIVYGAGKVGRACVDKYLACGLDKMELCLTDSNSSLWGGDYRGLEIKSPNNTLTDNVGMVVIAVGDKYKEEVKQLLKDKYHIIDRRITYYAQTLVLPGCEIYGINNSFFIDMNKNVFGMPQYFDMWYELYKISLRGMNIGGGGNIETSGELNVLKLLKASGKNIEVIFDVGANVGAYTRALLSVFPRALIYCFEPAKETFHSLSNNFVEQNVILNNIGISDEVANRTLYYDKENSGLASLYNRELGYMNKKLNCKEQIELTTLDHFCQSHDINKIDFLKMDIEGNEYKALMGASGLLREKKIGAIQIETGGANIDSRTYFRDFWNLLDEDYEVFRVLQGGLKKIEKYEETLECFVTTNWLFIKRSEEKDDK